MGYVIYEMIFKMRENYLLKPTNIIKSFTLTVGFT